MAKENPTQLRQLIAQKAAQMMAEDGISDFSYAKNKAGRQIGALDNSVPVSYTHLDVYKRQGYDQGTSVGDGVLR